MLGKQGFDDSDGGDNDKQALDESDGDDDVRFRTPWMLGCFLGYRSIVPVIWLAFTYLDCSWLECSSWCYHLCTCLLVI